jgi:hypothetical protein
VWFNPETSIRLDGQHLAGGQEHVVPYHLALELQQGRRGRIVADAPVAAPTANATTDDLPSPESHDPALTTQEAPARRRRVR